MAGISVVFDFNEMIIGCDSDKRVVDEMGATSLFNELHSTIPWNSLMGSIIERIKASLASAERKTRFIYVGDGKGDFCPSTKLKEGDHVMPRKNFPLWAMICTNPTAVKAEVHEWCDAEELNRVLIRLVKTLSLEDDSLAQSLSATECKLESLSKYGLQAFVLPDMKIFWTAF